MIPSLIRLVRREEGLALIVSLMVAFVVLLLSAIVVAQSIHSLDSSGYDRRRLQSINSAEAGLNFYYQHLQTTEIDAVDCDGISGTLATEPATATFSATPTFYAADGVTEMSCPFSTTNYPSYASIRSTGEVADQTPRSMESLIRLTPDYGGFGAAMLAVNATSFGNNFDLYGSSGDNGDVYILNGDLTITNSPQIHGNVYVPQGGVTMSNNNSIWGTLWARDDITINNPASVRRSVLSELGDILGNGQIRGSATAPGSIDGSLDIWGTVSPGTAVPTTPTQTFPVIGWVPGDWAGYTVLTHTCASARTYLQTTTITTATVIRITGATACTFGLDNNKTINLQANLAIVTDWGVELNNRSNWNGSAGAVKNLYFISVAPAASCPASGSTNKNMNVGNNTNFNTYVQVLFYTPCTATMSNSNNFNGQVLATNVNVSNNWKMTYSTVLVPGVTEIVGFKQDISYVREVV